MGLSSRATAIIVLFLVFFGGIALILSLPRAEDGPEYALENGVTHTQILLGESEEEVFGGEDEGLDPGYYTLFSLNVHDWTHPNESMATVERVLDIHEEYGVPVDIYFTDPLFRMTVEKDPEFIERLKNSSVATVAYHIRPPYPYYSNFDWFGLSSLSRGELYNTLYAYETHALDLESGMYTDESGGYAYVRDVMGYAPISVGAIPVGSIGEVLAQVYVDLGATFMVTHGKDSMLGDTFGSTELFMRPEHADVKIYEEARTTQDGGAVLEEYMQEAYLDRPFFLGVKYHEDNFYIFGGTPWWLAFFSSSEQEKRAGETSPRIPPFPLDQALTGSWRMQTVDENAQDWELYESAVRYVAEHPELLTPLNLRILKNLL